MGKGAVIQFLVTFLWFKIKLKSEKHVIQKVFYLVGKDFETSLNNVLYQIDQRICFRAGSNCVNLSNKVFFFKLDDRNSLQLFHKYATGFMNTQRMANKYIYTPLR